MLSLCFESKSSTVCKLWTCVALVACVQLCNGDATRILGVLS